MTTPAELGWQLRIPEAATASLLAILVREGKVKMRWVERTANPAENHTTETTSAKPDAA